MIELKLGDIYTFRYNEEYYKNHFEPHHCFDGQLKVKKANNGELYLEDSYWSSCENYTFSLEGALEYGELTFICNIDDIEEIDEWKLDYYDDKDLFDLSYQHGAYKSFYKNKNATKSSVKMEMVLKENIKTIENEISYQNRQLKNAKENLEKLQNGDMDIYI